MTAKQAIYEMRKWDATKAANRSRLVPMDQWADAIESELAAGSKALIEAEEWRLSMMDVLDKKDASIEELECRLDRVVKVAEGAIEMLKKVHP